MAEVAYLLGAGASAECLPVVNKMAQDIEDLSIEINKLLNYEYGGSTDKNREFVDEKLVQLTDICRNHYSIDTYAKKLYLTDSIGFKNLKIDLCFYFTARQILTNPDKRYDNMFASIIQSEGRLPKKLKILSWNYDFQLEASFQNFSRSKTLDECRSNLNMVSPKEYEELEYYYDRFSVVKLNGSARLRNINDRYSFMVENNLSNDAESILNLISKYVVAREDSNDHECELKFAWERQHLSNLIKHATPMLEKIKVLVVIGYSFPFFNREVDEKMFDQFRGLDKIIIQDKYPENIKEVMVEMFSNNFHSNNEPNIILKSIFT
ncbi:MAG: hypothetical protein EOO93_14750 [Pedobacter sp.]|nr:MAG: hypothetical protein EOO93_14750 [Pedobacter sp.]